MKALIVDDERLARQELKRLLEPLKHVTVAGEAANAQEARAFLKANPVDLLLLDIQMPGETGFDLLQSLETTPPVIFTTAYDEYALKAFETNALDYLLKPIEAERLAEAIDRVHATTEAEKAATEDTTTLPANTDVLSINDRVFLKDGEKCWFVRLGDVFLIESVGNYAKLHFEDQRALIHRSLTQLEDRLDAKYFFRANRQEIINVQYIDKIEPYFSNTLLVMLQQGNRVEVSRRQSQKFKQLMSL